MTNNLPIKSVLQPLSDSIDDRLHSNILAIINYSEAAVPGNINPWPQINVPLIQLNDPPLAEVWYADSPVDYKQSEQLYYSVSDSVLFGYITIDNKTDVSFEQASYQAYKQILTVLEKEKFQSLLRTWNYFSEINGPEINGSEINDPDINKPNIITDAESIDRYKSFCLGRSNAFEKYKPINNDSLPAATVIGSKKGPGIIYFIASKSPGTQVENPRQISAYKYPAQYGPVSPSFSRSIHKNWGGASQLFISGTASIVGHETRHQNQYVAQLEEIIINLHSLIAHAEQNLKFNSKLQHIYPLKVYLRHPDYLDEIKSKLESYFSKDHPILYLQGDICRSSLLIEIEGIMHAPNN